MAWKPIDTVPHNTPVLMYEDGDVYKGLVISDGPDDDEAIILSHCGQYVTRTPEPTHWMPLPDEPTNK